MPEGKITLKLHESKINLFIPPWTRPFAFW